eukprot:scaffold13879_cov142-Isochrysis_galbana.AAC.2
MVLAVNDDVDALTLSLTTVPRDCSIACYNWPCLLPVSVRVPYGRLASSILYYTPSQVFVRLQNNPPLKLKVGHGLS